MGVTTDLFVADRKAVQDLVEDDYPPKLYPSVKGFKGMLEPQFAALEFTIDNGHADGCPQSEGFAGEVYDKCLEYSEEGPWVFVLPATLTEKLAKLDDSAMSRIAGLWTGTSDLRAFGYEKVHLLEGLGEFRRLAKIAMDKKKELFMYICL